MQFRSPVRVPARCAVEPRLRAVRLQALARRRLGPVPAACGYWRHRRVRRQRPGWRPFRRGRCAACVRERSLPQREHARRAPQSPGWPIRRQESWLHGFVGSVGVRSAWPDRNGQGCLAGLSGQPSAGAVGPRYGLQAHRARAGGSGWRRACAPVPTPAAAAPRRAAPPAVQRTAPHRSGLWTPSRR